MAYHVLEREQVLDRSLESVFEFMSNANNLARITPAGMGFRFVTPPPSELAVGAEIRYRLRVSGVPVSWTTRITEWDPPHRFADLQAAGPYRYWLHTHSFTALDDRRTLMRDRVIYRMPFGLFGEAVHVLFVGRQLRRIFDYRELAFTAALRAEARA